MTLYKDCYTIGQDSLYTNTKTWIQCSSRSLHHNIHVLHHVHKQWAKQMVNLSKVTSWRHLAAELNLTGPVAGVCLWIDSFNVHLAGVMKTSKKDPLWSYKLNSPGQCFMALLNAHGRFHALWGGYSPKVYDGDFLKMQCEFIETQLHGAVILGDNHFSYGETGFDRVRFITMLSCPWGCSVRFEGVRTLTQEQEHYNHEVASAHARVENGFGQVISIFDALKVAWHEDKAQQNTCVWTAVGVANKCIQ